MKRLYKIGMTGVLLLLFLAVSGCAGETPEVAPEDRILMVNDTLYYGTDETGPMGDADCVEGEILSTTKNGEIPTENGQSNFGGVGNPYTADFGDGGIMVFVGDEYFWFYADISEKQEAEKETSGERESEAPPESEDTEGGEEASQPETDGEKAGGELPDALPLDFIFSSGAGAWGTSLTLNGDGSFTGLYGDSDMGDGGEGYPGGKHYFCEFQGRFGNIQKLDENTCSMTLEELIYEPEPGEEEIKDGILYIASEPYGLETGKEFLLYLPETSVADLPEEFLSWWQNRYIWDGETAMPLGCYGIWNQEAGYGFFSDNVCPECGGTVSPQTGICNDCGKEVNL